MRRLLFALAPFAVAAGSSLATLGCSQTPVVVPFRSMERPKDVDLVCLWHQDPKTWRGVPLNLCHVGFDGVSAPVDARGNALPAGDRRLGQEFRLHAVVTQLSRGELAVVDLGVGPSDSANLVKVDPRLPGFTFLPVGAVPQDVVADPDGKAVYVASAHDHRIDVIPTEMLRGPVDTAIESRGTSGLPWPHLDLDPSEGAPTRLAAVKDGDRDRLYIALPEARGGGKIAVFDIGCAGVDDDAICVAALSPRRLGDIALDATTTTIPAFDSAPCRTTTGLPWWNEYDAKCGVGVPLRARPNKIVPSSTDPFHLGGIAVGGGLLFAADDTAQSIHVFDVTAGRGRELQRIDLGARTSRLSLSEPVPDEVTADNADAIETCELRGWLGDGKDHGGESSIVATKLQGRCRAHRYLYAVDYDDAQLGDGSIAVIDVPVVLHRDDKGAIVGESLDLAAAQLATPLSCDSPSFPITRVAFGSFGIGGQNNVPARAVTFVRYDPPSPLNALGGQRCRPTDPPQSGGIDLPVGALGPNGLPLPPLQTFTDAQASWRDNPDPVHRLRGTFAFVALDNGGLVTVDVDDYDALCRGPRVAGDVPTPPYFLPPGAPPLTPPSSETPLGAGATGEYTSLIGRRHHPRSARPFDATNVPAVTTVLLSVNGNALPFDPITPEGRVRPHLVPLDPAATAVPTVVDFVRTAADGPYAFTSENWTSTYQGVLPGFSGNAGTFADDGTLSDPGGAFCHRGVEAFDPKATDHNDLVQIVDDVCEAPSVCAADDKSPHLCCDTQATHDRCAARYGLSTDVPLAATRDLVIGQAFEQHLTIAQHVELHPGAPNTFEDGPPPDLHACFPGLTRYAVRARDTWVVYGTVSGFVHPVIPDPASTSADAACVLDKSRPSVFHARLHELPATATPRTSVDPCQRFVNATWQWAIEQGYDAAAKSPVASVRDMVFLFGVRFNFQPLYINSGSLPTALRPLAQWVGGVDVLGWNQIAVVDSIDKGLGVFGVGDFTNNKIVN